MLYRFFPNTLRIRNVHILHRVRNFNYCVYIIVTTLIVIYSSIDSRVFLKSAQRIRPVHISLRVFHVNYCVYAAQTNI